MDVGRDLRIFRRQAFGVAHLDVDRRYARPFGAGAEKPAAAPAKRAVWNV
jgi:hypothetical protein